MIRKLKQCWLLCFVLLATMVARGVCVRAQDRYRYR